MRAGRGWDAHSPRLCPADVVAYSIDADAIAVTLDKITGQRGTPPTFIRCDNGPQLTANALRAWCRFSGAGTSYIGPGSPRELDDRRAVHNPAPAAQDRYRVTYQQLNSRDIAGLA